VKCIFFAFETSSLDTYVRKKVSSENWLSKFKLTVLLSLKTVFPYLLGCQYILLFSSRTPPHPFLKRKTFEYWQLTNLKLRLIQCSTLICNLGILLNSINDTALLIKPNYLTLKHKLEHKAFKVLKNTNCYKYTTIRLTAKLTLKNHSQQHQH